MMRVQIFKYWERVRSSYWFLPTLMVAGAVGLSFVSVYVDRQLPDSLLGSLSWAFAGGAEGASAELGAVVGSMITLAGVVFSMTLVALSLASSQLGPRMLRNFMRDTATQVVLGTFVSTFLYCLLVLRAIRRTSGNTFVPHLSVNFGILLAVVSVGVLIYFIHHVSKAIQANEMVARVGSELIAGLNCLFPEQIGQGATQIDKDPPDASVLAQFDRDALRVHATGDGYVQLIDAEALMALAIREDVVIRLEQRPGDYAIAGCPLLKVYPPHCDIDKLSGPVNAAFVLGNQRITDQDVEFAVNQLVEVAVRALSPGLNDPFTAVACIDRLGSALSRMAARDWPSPYRHDQQGQLRVIAQAASFPVIADAVFTQIRQYGSSSSAVLTRMLETIAKVAGFTRRPEDCAALLRQAEMIVRAARDGLSEEGDRQVVEAHYQKALSAAAAGGAGRASEQS